jgi:hydroxyacylglutathione hydrolase
MNLDHKGTSQSGPIPQVIVLKVQHRAMKNYSYLVVDAETQQALIVDPAWEMETIEQAINATQSKLQGILITHSHPDHIHLARPLAEQYDCPIWMSKEEIVISGFRAPQLTAIEKDIWLVGQMVVEAILAPGHTPGCVCYVIGDNAFTGDVLFAEGCGICPDLMASHAMFDSLQKLQARLKPFTRIFPGHSYGNPPGQMLWQLLKQNIYLQFTDKHSFAAFRLRSGQNRASMFNFS